jgi:hypothetical protein
LMGTRTSPMVSCSMRYSTSSFEDESTLMWFLSVGELRQRLESVAVAGEIDGGVFVEL